MDQTLRFSADYKTHFNPKEYLNRWYKTPESDIEEGYFLSFYLTNFHKFWSSLGSNNLTMLEFGGGPCIHTLISACPFVREIVFAEFTEANRKEVEAWQKRESSSHDWSPIVNYVVQNLEGKSEEEATTREEELRRKISRIVPCDIRQTKPLHLNESSTTDQIKFDIVSTTSCIAAAVETDSEYCKAVAKMSQLLKPGGQLVMAGIINDSFCMVGDQKFYGHSLNENLVRRALHDAGFVIADFSSTNKGTADTGSKGFFFTCAVLKPLLK